MTGRRELVLLLLVAAGLLGFSSLPDLAGYHAQNETLAFGGTYFDPSDYAVHLSMLQAGMRGAWGYQLRFTSEQQRTVYSRLFYVGLGEINRLVQAMPAAAFQVARLIFGFAALLAIYLVAKRGFEGFAPGWHWLAFSMTVLGSGVGWLQRVAGWVPGPITPIDFWLIDPYVLFGISLFPHFAFSMALMCLALALYVDFLAAGNWLRVAVIVFAAVLSQLVNPIAFLGVDVAMAVLTILSSREQAPRKQARWVALIAIGCAQIPLLIYNVQLLRQDPTWSQFASQNQTLSPPPVYYLWGFGLLWPLVVVGTIQAIRRRRTLLLGAAAWAATCFLMAYSPTAIQRRFLLGITIPLGLLAAFGAMCLLDFASKRSNWVSIRVTGLAVLIGVLVALNTVILILAQTLYMLRRPADYFYPRELNAGLQWIAAKTQPDDIILTAARTGQLVAQFTGRRVYVGHEMETLYYPTKVAEVTAFYRGELAADWLSGFPICWVVYGPYERDIAPEFPNAGYLTQMYSAAGVQVYKTRDCR